MVDTEFFSASGLTKFDTDLLKHLPLLESKDVVDAVLYILGTPPHVQV
jgi:hypothetical protein